MKLVFPLSRWFAALALIMTHLAFINPVAKTPAHVLLADTSGIEKMPQYQKAAKASPDKIEKAKIEYLIARVKLSQGTFIRNGVSYGGGRASLHLTWKYSRKSGQVKTALDFVDVIASRSSMSGEEYKIKFADGSIYPARDIFKNELDLLEENLSKQSHPSLN